MTANEIIGWLFLALIGLAVWQSFKVRPDRSVECDDPRVIDDARTNAHVSMRARK